MAWGAMKPGEGLYRAVTQSRRVRVCANETDRVEADGTGSAPSAGDVARLSGKKRKRGSSGGENIYSGSTQHLEMKFSTYCTLLEEEMAVRSGGKSPSFSLSSALGDLSFYLAQCPLHDWKELHEDLRIRELLQGHASRLCLGKGTAELPFGKAEEMGIEPNLWVSVKKSVADWHYDQHDGFLVVLAGRVSEESGALSGASVCERAVGDRNSQHTQHTTPTHQHTNTPTHQHTNTHNTLSHGRRS